MSKRLSVTLDRGDEQAVSRFAEPDTPERRALTTWAERHGHNVGSGHSEAAVLRLLVRAGVEALAEDVLDAGYAQLAADLSQEEREETAELRRRYLRRTEAVAGE